MSVVVVFGGFERSPWILMTAPDAEHATVPLTNNTLWGYSGLIGSRPLHRENLYFFRHMLLFSGGEVPQDFYILRPVYAFLASSLAPALGWLPSMLVLNLVAWISSVWLVYIFALRVTGQRWVAFFACLLSIGGLGFVTHVHDYSAHLLAFTFYYGMTYLVYVSEVWQRRRDWKIHAALGLALAIASLQYNTGLAAAVAYVATSLRHNGVLRPLIVLVAVYLCTAVWPLALNALSGLNVDYRAIERAYLAQTVEDWMGLLGAPRELSKVYFVTLANYTFYEMPFLVVGGLIGIVALLLSKRNVDFLIYVFALFMLPIAAVSVYAGAKVAKGYLTYQTSIFIYLGLGYLLHRLAAARIGSTGIAFLAGTLLIGQLAWNLSFLVGATGPVKLYFLGISDLAAWLPDVFSVPKVISLTGLDSVPILFRGSSTVLDSGGVTCAGQVQPSASSWAFLNAILLRAPFAALFAAAVFLYLRAGLFRPQFTQRRQANALGVGAGVFVTLSLSGASLNLQLAAHDFPKLCLTTEGTSKVAKARDLLYEVEVSTSFIAELAAATATAQDIEIIHGYRYAKLASPTVQVALIAGERRIPLDAKVVHTVDRHTLIVGLQASGRLALEVRNMAAELPTEGWQRNGLPGRRLFADGQLLGPKEQDMVPVLEVRAREAGGIRRLKLAGF